MAVSFTLFPKPLSFKYVLGGLLVAVSLYWLQRSGGKRAAGTPADAIDGAVPSDGPKHVNMDMAPGTVKGSRGIPQEGFSSSQPHMEKP